MVVLERISRHVVLMVICAQVTYNMASNTNFGTLAFVPMGGYHQPHVRGSRGGLVERPQQQLVQGRSSMSAVERLRTGSIVNCMSSKSIMGSSYIRRRWRRENAGDMIRVSMSRDSDLSFNKDPEDTSMTQSEADEINKDVVQRLQMQAERLKLEAQRIRLEAERKAVALEREKLVRDEKRIEKKIKEGKLSGAAALSKPDLDARMASLRMSSSSSSSSLSSAAALSSPVVEESSISSRISSDANSPVRTRTDAVAEGFVPGVDGRPASHSGPADDERRRNLWERLTNDGEGEKGALVPPLKVKEAALEARQELLIKRAEEFLAERGQSADLDGVPVRKHLQALAADCGFDAKDSLEVVNRFWDCVMELPAEPSYDPRTDNERDANEREKAIAENKIVDYDERKWELRKLLTNATALYTDISNMFDAVNDMPAPFRMVLGGPISVTMKMANAELPDVAMRAGLLKRLSPLVDMTMSSTNMTVYDKVAVELLGDSMLRWAYRELQRTEGSPSVWQADEALIKDVALMIGVCWLKSPLNDWRQIIPALGDMADMKFMEEDVTLKGALQSAVKDGMIDYDGIDPVSLLTSSDRSAIKSQLMEDARKSRALEFLQQDSMDPKLTPLTAEDVQSLKEVLENDAFQGVKYESVTTGLGLFRGTLAQSSDYEGMVSTVEARVQAVDGLADRVNLFFLDDGTSMFLSEMDDDDQPWPWEQSEIEMVNEMLERAKEGPKSCVLALSTQSRPKDEWGGAQLTAFLGAAGLFTTWATALGSYALNDDFYDKVITQGDYSELGQALPLMGIILGLQAVHDVGHLVVAATLKLKTNFPRIIPSLDTGLFSSSLHLKGYPKNNNELFDFAVAGPLLGLLCSSIVLALGLGLTGAADASLLSTFPRVPASLLQNSVVLGQLVDIVLPSASITSSDLASTVSLHPLAVGGIFGLYSNFMALIPFGRTDGRNAAKAALGGIHQLLASIAWPCVMLEILLGDNPVLSMWCASLVLFFRGESLITRYEGKRASTWRTVLMSGLLIATFIFFCHLPLSEYLSTGMDASGAGGGDGSAIPNGSRLLNQLLNNINQTPNI